MAPQVTGFGLADRNIRRFAGAVELRYDLGMTDASSSVTGPGKQRPGPKPRISKVAIARAALEIGLDTVTVKAVAARLGVDHSSLYRHVTSQAEIVALAADIAIAELEWRRTDADWRVMLEHLAEAVWDLYERHPGLAAAFRDLTVMPPSAILAFSEAVAQLQKHGFALTDSLLAVDTLMDALTDSFAGWHTFKRKGPQGITRADTVAAKWDLVADSDDRFSEQIRGMIDVMHAEPRAWWLRRRALILDGIAALPRDE